MAVLFILVIIGLVLLWVFLAPRFSKIGGAFLHIVDLITGNVDDEEEEDEDE